MNPRPFNPETDHWLGEGCPQDCRYCRQGSVAVEIAVIPGITQVSVPVREVK